MFKNQCPQAIYIINILWLKQALVKNRKSAKSSKS